MANPTAIITGIRDEQKNRHDSSISNGIFLPRLVLLACSFISAVQSAQHASPRLHIGIEIVLIRLDVTLV